MVPIFQFPVFSSKFSSPGLQPTAHSVRPKASGLLLLFAWFIGINLIGLMLVAVWFRCQLLDNIPGLNGDEAWYGVEAVEMLRGTATTWQTPTGNPLNPFFIGPLILLHLWFGPSIVLLRSVAVVSGLLALLINWVLCRWVFDGRMAWISTIALAVLPIDIAYSRFAWDASQSLAATLQVVYFSLAAIRFPKWNVRLIVAAIVCQVIAVLVHPTNIFAATAIAAVVAAQWKPGNLSSSIRRILKHPLIMTAVLALCVLIGLWIIWLARSPMSRLLVVRLEELTNSNDMLNASICYPRLFTGGTIYRYIAGSHSWFEWPLAFDSEGFGADVLVFWLLIPAAGIILWRSWKSASRKEDGALIAAWALTMAAFLLFAGPRAMSPGYERFAICLIAPTIILLSRAVALACSWNLSASRITLLAAMLVGWFMLADFHAHYFRFIERTGGQAHLTFRTGAEEPKAAALKYILEHRKPGETLIVAHEWWNLWPLRYLSAAESDLRVLRTPDETAKEGEKNTTTKKEVRVWYVEFSNSGELLKIEAEFTREKLTRRDIKDYAGRPILTVLHQENKMGIGH